MLRILSIISIAIFVSCGDNQPQPTEAKDSSTIAISKFYPDSIFEKWLLRYNKKLNFIELYGLRGKQLEETLSHCDGLILSGGADVACSIYHETDLDSLCGRPDTYRDSIEILSYNYAFQNRIPVLGICRGMQLMNVASGGNLIMDIPIIKKSNIHQIDSADAVHSVRLKEGSVLALRTASISGEVNSNHHQSIDKIGNGFDVIAYAPDSVAEAIHFTDSDTHPFLLAVQWHPERMDVNNALSREPAKLFLIAVKDRILQQVHH